ncbi:MAG: hypothetical protein IPK21_18645 [Haliscomenobacter sp.]|nr:hypothetical protein [Haliscomenobacter sp.]
MNPAFSLLMLCLCFQGVDCQSPVSYTLYDTTASPKFAIHIDIDPIPADAARLIIPRSAPGTYSLTDYLPFVDQVRGLTAAGGVLEGAPGDGSYFSFSGKDQQITGIRYEVDVRLMEERLLDGSSSSKMRNNYLGILGYSVFGYIAGQEDRPIALTIETQAGWPIFSTLRPAVERHSPGKLSGGQLRPAGPRPGRAYPTRNPGPEIVQRRSPGPFGVDSHPSAGFRIR